MNNSKLRNVLNINALVSKNRSKINEADNEKMKSLLTELFPFLNLINDDHDDKGTNTDDDSDAKLENDWKDFVIEDDITDQVHQLRNIVNEGDNKRYLARVEDMKRCAAQQKRDNIFVAVGNIGLQEQQYMDQEDRVVESIRQASEKPATKDDEQEPLPDNVSEIEPEEFKYFKTGLTSEWGVYFDSIMSHRKCNVSVIDIKTCKRNWNMLRAQKSDEYFKYVRMTEERNYDIAQSNMLVEQLRKAHNKVPTTKKN
jgi:hypothetical protein